MNYLDQEIKPFIPFRHSDSNYLGLYMIIGSIKKDGGLLIAALNIEKGYVYCEILPSINEMTYANGSRKDFIIAILSKCEWGDNDGSQFLFNEIIGKEARDKQSLKSY